MKRRWGGASGLIIFVGVGCVIAGDSLVAVKGRLIDEEARPYEDCVVSLRSAKREEQLLEHDLHGQLNSGQFRESFIVPGRWADCYVVFTCRGSAENFRSARIGRDRLIPIDLGDIVLERFGQ